MSADQQHVMIVEDSMTQAFSLEYLLSENGYRVTIANNGLQALEMAHLHRPDLVVSDITMPIMGGFEFCSRAKSDPVLRLIPILLLTDLSNPDDIIHGLEARADGYITKPYEEGFLLRKIRTLLDMRELPPADEEGGQAIEFIFNGEKHVITASRKHILDMFISTYEHSLAQMKILERNQRELNDINAKLAASLDSLKMSEERFRSLVETVPDIVYRLDAEGRFSFLNSAIERLGYHRGELLGTHFSEIIVAGEVNDVSWQDAVARRRDEGMLPPVPPKLFDERRSGQRMTAGLEVRLRTKSGVTVEHGEVKPLAHSPLVVEISSSGLYGEGSEMRRNYVGTVGVIRDITDRKRAQDALSHEREFLEKLINTVPLPIFLVDTNGAIQRANSALFRFFGLGAETTLGRRWHDVLPPETAERLAAGDMDDKDENIYEANLVAADGDERMVVVTKIRFDKPGEGAYGQIGVLIDVTERTRTETELRNAKRLADEATRAKSEFLATMSHELRTPLNAILGFSEMINMNTLEGECPPRYRDYAASIYESGAHLLEIINDILDISAVEAGKLTLHPEEIDIAALVTSAERLIQVRAEKRKLGLVVDLAVTPTRLLVDKRRLKQILINLLGNSVKFTPEGGSITLAVAPTSSGGVRFIVSDTGIGMDADGIAKALTLFGQVDSRLARKYEGTGLGLPLSKHLAESLGGTLEVESVLGQGTSVIVTLPPGCVIA